MNGESYEKKSILLDKNPISLPFGHIPSCSRFIVIFSSFEQLLPSLNYLLKIEFARYKISTNWDHKADWANGKGGVSRSAIDYRHKSFPSVSPYCQQIQYATTCTTTTGIRGMQVSGLGLDGGSSSGYGSSGKAERLGLGEHLFLHMSAR